MTSTDVRIAWERRGEGPPLLLIHGLGYARWGWEPVADLLAADFTVLLFDNRGIGASDAPGGPYTAALMAQDALQVLDEAGVERAHVVGTSLGGMVAQELALAHPERVDRLVLACTTPGPTHGVPMPEVTVNLMRNGGSLRDFVENALAPDVRPELVDRILEHRVATAQPLEAWGAQAAAGLGFDAGARVRAIGAPTLIQHGTGDLVVDPRNADALAGLIPGSRVELYDGAGHLFFWQQPERFARELVEFAA
jgi:3-oxoadipate enol-lactonase